MRTIRFSIKGLMSLVGVIALNFALLLPLVSLGPPAVIGVGAPWIILQVAFFRFIRSRGRARTFWAGFLALGLVATALFYWATTHARNVGIGRDATGKFVRTVFPGSPLWDALAAYTAFVGERLQLRTLFSDFQGPYGELIGVLTTALVWFLPQFLFALAGGMLACVAARLITRGIQGATDGSKMERSPENALAGSQKGGGDAAFRINEGCPTGQ